MIRAAALVLSFALDHGFGEPPTPIHPVAWLGHAIAVGRDWALRCDKLGQFLRGSVIAIAIPTTAAGITYALLRTMAPWFLGELVVTTLLLKPMFAVRALRDAAFVVRDALDRGDLAAARGGLSSLCSRKADTLDAPALIAATIESIAENASDSVVAPLFFFAAFGLPGAVFYRAVNTLDAMIGYHGRFEYVGKTSARLDDLLNLAPARLTALLLLAAGAITGADARRGLRILRRDGTRTESPNAGWPMAAMAGLLGLRLEKIDHYALGDAHRPSRTADITTAWRIVSIASLGALLLAVLALLFLGSLGASHA